MGEIFPFEKCLFLALRVREIDPEKKGSYPQDIAFELVERFAATIHLLLSYSPFGRLEQMASDLFWDCCRLGTRQAVIRIAFERTPKKPYKEHSDMREDGFLNLKVDLPKNSALGSMTRKLDLPSRKYLLWRQLMHPKDDNQGWWL
jgi:hypothetical protein